MASSAAMFGLGNGWPSSSYSAEKSATLRERATSKGLFCGSCLDIKHINDQRLLNVISVDCNILVPENGFNWTRLQRVPGSLVDYSQAEAVYQVARRAKMPMRGHNMIWYRTMPAWAEVAISSMTASTAGDFMVAHCQRIAADWKGRLIHHEVVNEPTAGRGLIPFSLSAKLGERYIDLAFEAVHEADPDATLCLNINMVEMDAREDEMRRTDILKLLEGLIARNVPVHCLGIEGHLRLKTRFREDIYDRFLKDVCDMGLDIIISEFDVNDRLGAVSEMERDAEVAALGRAFLDVSFAAPQCLGVLTWGATDAVSWLRRAGALLAEGKQRTDGLPLRPTLRDDAYRRKPLWHAMAAALDAASPRVTPKPPL